MKSKKHYEQIAKADRVTRCDNQKESSKCQRYKNSDYPSKGGRHLSSTSEFVFHLQTLGR